MLPNEVADVIWYHSIPSVVVIIHHNSTDVHAKKPVLEKVTMILRLENLLDEQDSKSLEFYNKVRVFTLSRIYVEESRFGRLASKCFELVQTDEERVQSTFRIYDDSLDLNLE